MEADYQSLCRLCAEADDSCDCRNIFHIQSEGEIDLVGLIETRLSIHITAEDKLPLNICQKCRDELESFDLFHRKCNRAQISLESMLPPETLETYDSVSVKVEPDIKLELESDDDHEDLIPISQMVSYSTVKELKRKSKSSQPRGKRKKIKVSEDEADDDIDSDLDDSPKLPKKKHLINNSFFKFICHVCNEKFKNWSRLKTHVSDTHSEKAKVTCICEKYLYSRHAIHRHIIKHDSSVGIKCKECDKTFSSTKALESHSIVHIPKDQYPHVCSHCAKRFATMLTLKAHEKTHLPKEMRYIHKCEVCDAKFPTKSSVKSHISAVHEKFRPYICDICGHAFNNKGNLLDHRVLHSEEKLHTCPKCPKKFKTKGTLQRHIDCHNDTSYKCPQCPAILNSRRTLRTHMFIHDKFCRYVCAFCHKGFKRRKTLKAHIFSHTGERPYSCLWCPKLFADNSNCRIHKKRMHPNELAEYEAAHATNQEVKKDKTAEKEVIYNMIFKVSENTNPIVIPKLEINSLCNNGTFNPQ